MAPALQSQASWNRVSEDSIMAGTPNALLNAFLPVPLEVVWIGNGTSLLVLTDDNQGCSSNRSSNNCACAFLTDAVYFRVGVPQHAQTGASFYNCELTVQDSCQRAAHSKEKIHIKPWHHICGLIGLAKKFYVGH